MYNSNLLQSLILFKKFIVDGERILKIGQHSWELISLTVANWEVFTSLCIHGTPKIDPYDFC